MFKKWITEYIEINKREILIVVGLLFLGIVVGIGIYIFAASSTKALAIESVKSVFEISKSEEYIKTNIVANGIKSDILLIFILAMLSVTLFGKWIIYLIVMLKGVAITIYTILLFNIFGPLWGIVAFILLVILVNMLYLPAFIYLTISFLEINFNIFKAKLKNVNPFEMYKIFMVVFFCFVVMFSSIMVEQLASSLVLNIYTKL